MEVYQFGAASSILYDFVYDDFCSYYLEMSKLSLTHPERAKATKDTLYTVIRQIILLIYPYCPFVAEEMYLSLPGHKDSIMLESYPEFEADLVDKKAEKQGKLLAKMLSDIRGYKAEQKLAPNAKIKLALIAKSPLPGNRGIPRPLPLC
jgi:valyl-tRNA synthetase